MVKSKKYQKGTKRGLKKPPKSDRIGSLFPRFADVPRPSFRPLPQTRLHRNIERTRMTSFIFALEAVAPIVLMVALGYFFKRLGWMSESFAKEANRIVFRAFMPIMLFLNIYRIDDLAGQDFTYMLYTVGALLLIFFCALPAVIALTKRNDRRGVLLQAAFRSGYTLIGIDLAGKLNPAFGAQAASLLAAAVIPLFNVLAVISLSIFNEKGEKPSVKSILLGIVKNPLIIGIAAGAVAFAVKMAFGNADIDFRLENVGWFYTVLDYLSRAAIPMALLVLGAQFEFSGVRSMRCEIIFGVAVRSIIVPLIVIGASMLLFKDRFTAAHYACIISVFTTPVAVTIGPMAQEMGGDVELAGQLVVWSTIVSALTMFLSTFLLRLLGAL